MPLSDLTKVVTSIAGTDPDSPAAATPDAGGHMFKAEGNELLEVRNVGAAVLSVVIDTPGTVQGSAVEQRVVSVPALAASIPGRRIIGPFKPSTFNRPSDAGSAPGKVLVTYGNVGTVNGVATTGAPADARVKLYGVPSV
jgi:hypothetical protein